MKKCHLISVAFLVAIIISSTTAFAQDIHVTFSGTGAATRVDSVIATNLATSESVSLPGNETLVLTANSGIPTDSELAGIGIVYPNPFSGTTALSISISKPQMVSVRIQNLVGQIVAQTNENLQPGDNEFTLTVNAAGVYWVSVISEQGTGSYKVICTEATDAVNRIHYRGIGYHNLQLPENKSSQTVYTLGYKPGEIILYKCYSGKYATVLTDSPVDSRNYEVEFVACLDADARGYSIVNIGNQTWMAENLAYLPAVSPPDTVSGAEQHCYVYGYEGDTVNKAKETTNYTTYGVLYNWEAAKAACPSGWHLPGDDEWMILEKYLGMSESDANNYGLRDSGEVGKKLRSAAGWNAWGATWNGDNSSEFNALPGGDLNSNIVIGDMNLIFFVDLGLSAEFWSALEDGASVAWGRFLYHHDDAVARNTTYRSDGLSVRCVKDQ